VPRSTDDSPAANWARNRLGYSFHDPALLALALTHRSHGRSNNERLEFLGDGVLNMLVAEWLYDAFPAEEEGLLSRLRATLVRKETLASLGAELGLGEHLLLGGGELKSGGARRRSILADGLEAVIGAVYKDGGAQAVHEVVLRMFDSRLASVDPRKVAKDPKTRLQEHLQKHGAPVPDYRVIEVRGAPHDQHFVVECSAETLPGPVRGEGRSRRSAEQDAATRALAALTGAG